MDRTKSELLYTNLWWQVTVIRCNTLTLMLVSLFFSSALLIPSMTNAQTTSSYGNNSHVNPTAFTLTIYSPDNQTYSITMPLNFTIDWTEYPTFTFPSPPAPKLYGTYTYTIDSYLEVPVSPNQSSNATFGYSNFNVNPAFFYIVNTSSLTNGYHKIVITASLYGDENLFLTATSSPVQFLVQNPTPSPTPHSPELFITPFVIWVLVAMVIIVAATVFLMFKKRLKTKLTSPQSTPQNSTSVSTNQIFQR